MVPKTPSARTPVAGPPTTLVRKPLAGISPFGCPSDAAALPRLLRGPSMVPVCPIKPRHFVAGTAPNETNGTHYRYKTCVLSYDECPICTLSRYDCCPCRSCAGPNPGAIKYGQFTADIALEETERCKRLVLEHHKWHRMRISEARNVSSHPRPPAKRQGTRERARACPALEHGGEGDSRRFNHATCNNRKTLWCALRVPSACRWCAPLSLTPQSGRC